MTYKTLSLIICPMKVNVFFSISVVTILLSCSHSSSLYCKNDMDCPKALVCKNNECVGLYENIDVSDSPNGYADFILFDKQSLSEDENNAIDAESYDNEIENFLENIQDTGDSLIRECNTFSDCETGFECLVWECINNRCSSEIRDAFCLIEGKCYKDHEANPSEECLECNSLIDKKNWSQKEGDICRDDGLECTNDICKSGICIHPYKDKYEKCILSNADKGICDGLGNCVKCIRDNDCDNTGYDIKCEGYYCDKGECKYYSREGNYCGEGVWECRICRDNKCECNFPHFRCEDCIPSCGYLGGSCCSGDSGCSGEFKSAYDCEKCCIGQCIPY